MKLGTAIGRMGDGVVSFRAEDLAAVVIEGLFKKTKINPQENVNKGGQDSRDPAFK